MKTEESGISRRSFLAAASGVANRRRDHPCTGHRAGHGGPTGDAVAIPVRGTRCGCRAQGRLLPLLQRGGCGHGSAQAIIDALAAGSIVNNPWPLLPRKLYSYGAGGVVGWGTICGALNGSIAVMGILNVHGALGNALIDYFCNTELPTNALVGWNPASDGWVGVPVPLPSTVTHISYSPLCHNSVWRWAATAGVPIWPVSTPDRAKSDHCAKLVGNIVARAVDLMNDRFLRGITPAVWTPPASYSGCYNCHTQPGMIPSQQGKMACQACHDAPPAHGT